MHGAIARVVSASSAQSIRADRHIVDNRTNKNLTVRPDNAKILVPQRTSTSGDEEIVRTCTSTRTQDAFVKKRRIIAWTLAVAHSKARKEATVENHD
jgi:hypothetical protein